MGVKEMQIKTAMQCPMLLKNWQKCKCLIITHVSDDTGEVETLTQPVGVGINILGRKLAVFGKMEDASTRTM